MTATRFNHEQERAEVIADLRRYWPNDVEVRVAADMLESDAATIQSLRAQVDRLTVKCEALRKDADAKQARIDELMIEYCPLEMTEEQVEEWGKHQRLVSDEDAAKIRAALDTNAGEGSAG